MCNQTVLLKGEMATHTAQTNVWYLLTLHVKLFPFGAELSKHKRYEIRMSVYNAVGEGPSSPPQEVFVGEAGMCASLVTFVSCRLV